MSRSESSLGVSETRSSASRSSGRSPVRSTSTPPCGAMRRSVEATLTQPPRGNQAELLEPLDDERRGLLRCEPLGIHHDLCGSRRLVRVVHAGEARDLAGKRLCVEPVHIATGALVERRLHVDLDERTVLLDQRALRRACS